MSGRKKTNSVHKVQNISQTIVLQVAWGDNGFKASYHLIFVGCPLEHALGPLNIKEDIGKDTDGILVSSHHKVCKTHIVIGSDLAFWHS